MIPTEQEWAVWNRFRGELMNAGAAGNLPKLHATFDRLRSTFGPFGPTGPDVFQECHMSIQDVLSVAVEKPTPIGDLIPSISGVCY